MRGIPFVFIICFYSGLCLHAQSKLSFSSPKFINEIPSEKDVELEHADDDLHKMPFELVGGLIFLDAELGGECDQYILDTGAPTLILNSKVNSNSKNISYVSGFSGRVAIVTKRVKGFQMGEVYKKSILAYYTDISHLESVKNRQVKGLIGVDAFRNKEVLFDYSQKQVMVLNRKKRQQSIGKYKEVHRIKFRKQDHLPVVRVKIGKKTFYFGIDTGAEVNIMSKRLLKKIKPENIEISNQKKAIRGIDKKSKTAVLATINNLSLKGMELNDMEFVFADISHINQSHSIYLDGILGYPFLSSETFSIDFKRNKLCLWEETTPSDSASPTELVAVGEKEK